MAKLTPLEEAAAVMAAAAIDLLVQGVASDEEAPYFSALNKAVEAYVRLGGSVSME